MDKNNNYIKMLKIGELLRKEGFVGKEDIERALQIQKEENEIADLPVEQYMLRKNLLTKAQLAKLKEHPEYGIIDTDDLAYKLNIISKKMERGAGGPGARAEALRCETLDDLLGVLGRTSLFLGNDSGPGHLAAALGVPTVSVFGPSDPAIWRPLGRWVRILAPRESCSPCSAGPPVPCEEVRCLEGISAEEVARIGLELLRTARPGSAPAPD